MELMKWNEVELGRNEKKKDKQVSMCKTWQMVRREAADIYFFLPETNGK